jgi:hypothetical protein
MFGQTLRKLIALLLVVVCPSVLLMAERPSAMLYATGAVTLNGTPAAKSMSVFAGDRIDTADASVVSVTRSGSSLIVDPNSSIQYQSDGFTILKGTARVQTSKGMSAHAGSLSVIPKDNSARFDVSSDGKTILVASREGTLTLTDGTETATLKPGYTAKVSFADDSPNPAATTTGGQDQNPNPASTTTGQWSKRKQALVILIFASAIAAIVACVVACSPGPSAITPTLPGR